MLTSSSHSSPAVGVNGRERLATIIQSPSTAVPAGKMDLQMTPMDGVTAIETICHEHPGARILVLTTYKGDARALRALSAGACGYLLKSMVRKDLSPHFGARTTRQT